MIEQDTTIEDFATSPGSTLQDSIEALGMSQAELAKRTGLSTKTINLIIKGTEPVSNTTALALEKVLRVPAHFWLKMESNYREHLARLEEAKTMASYTTWTRGFSYPAMVRNKFVPPAPKAEEKAKNLLGYFGVASPGRWKSVYGEMEASLSYRRSAKGTDANKKKKFADLSAWLRQGELLANDTQTADFDPKKFREVLKGARQCTLADPTEFESTLQGLCASAGVIHLLVPEMPGLGISGVMRWFHGRPLIQQSLLFKTNDHFWFTFFHEGKHVLQEKKKQIFLEGDSAGPADANREAEADAFARDLLIPSEFWESFCEAGRFTPQAIKRFASELEIHPGIVAGRLLREKHLEGYHLPQANLRQKLAWA
jgi:HTH-type transcriptional regulator/antitoxin HigA